MSFKFNSKPLFLKVQSILQELLKALMSKDPASQCFAAIFWLSSIALFVVMETQLVHLIQKLRIQKPVSQDQLLLEKLQSQQKEIVEKATSSSLLVDTGIFSINFESPSRKLPGQLVMKVGEIGFVIQADQIKTKEYLTSHIIELKSQIATYMTPMTQLVLMSREGKERIKADLFKRVNQWLPEGKVERIYISQLIFDESE